MSTVEYLQRELIIHRDIYEIARDKLIETENNLHEAIEEEELNKAADRARRIFFATIVGITMAAVAINVWA